MARFGIEATHAYGVSVPVLRKMATAIGPDHRLALDLWQSRVHEARLLAAFLDDPNLVGPRQMDRWAAEFDSWDLCDQCCGFLFDKTGHAYGKAVQWSKRKEEFVKRAGFVLMAALAVHDTGAGDIGFSKFLARVRHESCDERNFVRKAVNWALRQIGKRNLALNKEAVAAAKKIAKLNSSSARWIASDALRELTSSEVQARLILKSRAIRTFSS
jgi:3-methyladenine DNA glycosylase AlkD